MIKTVEDAIASAKSGSEVFKRDMSCSISKTDAGALAVSRFTDRYHDITLAMLVDSRTFEILDARAKLTSAPYPICRATEDTALALKGLSIYHRAVNREVRKRIGRRDGCTHLFELIEFTLASLFSGAPLAGMKSENSPDVLLDEDPETHRKRNLANPWLKNTCLAFRVDNDAENGRGEEQP